MKVLASPDLPSKIQSLRADDQTTESIRAALARLSRMNISELRASEKVVAAERGVYAMRQGSVRLFYTLNEADDYVILLDVATAPAENDRVADTADTLQDADWDAITKRLLMFTARQLQRYPDVFRRRAIVDAEDYTIDAIEALLSGRRRFDAEKKTLFSFLCGVIASQIEHDAEIADALHTTGAESRDTSDTLAPADLESEIAARELADQFIGSIDDVKLREYARLRLYDEHRTPSDYAAVLGVDKQTIYAMNKRLRRLRRLWAVDAKARQRAEWSPRRFPSEGGERKIPDLAPLDAVNAARDLPLASVEKELSELGLDPNATLADVVEELRSRG
jgi:mRNA-degrading endonuclease RelE of RelBE toxin-antitoxin system